MYPASFLTILTTSEGLFKEKGSKFISFAIPVEGEEEVKHTLAELKKKFYDARHCCYAYMLGADGKKFRAFDDGEPNHSAGTPILGQIKAKGVTNVLVVVIRYFGGIKLGVGGLAQAYKAAASNALAKAIIIEKEIKKGYIITFDYSTNTDVMQLMKEFELEINEQTYSEKCTLKVSVPVRNQSAFINKLIWLRELRSPIEFTELL
jgi:uncharacterized YigZ family protein